MERYSTKAPVDCKRQQAVLRYTYGHDAAVFLCKQSRHASIQKPGTPAKLADWKSDEPGWLTLSHSMQWRNLPEWFL